MWVQSMGREYPLDEGIAPLSSFLAWRIPWTEEVTKSQTGLSDKHFHAFIHSHTFGECPHVAFKAREETK